MNMIRLARGGGYLIPAPGMQFLVSQVGGTSAWYVTARQAFGARTEVWVVSDHASKEAAEDALGLLVAGLQWSRAG